MASRGQTDSRCHTGNGYVSKVLDGHGVIDDSIYFLLSVVQGPPVKVGDFVSFEAVFSDGGTFQWTANWVRPLGDKPHSRFGPPPQQQQPGQKPPTQPSSFPPPPQPPQQYPPPPRHNAYTGGFPNDPRSNYGQGAPPAPPPPTSYQPQQPPQPPNRFAPPPPPPPSVNASIPPPRPPHLQPQQNNPGNFPPPLRQDEPFRGDSRYPAPPRGPNPNGHPPFNQYHGPPGGPHGHFPPPPPRYGPPGGHHQAPPPPMPAHLDSHDWHRVTDRPPLPPGHQERFDARGPPPGPPHHQQGPHNQQQGERKSRFDREADARPQRPPPQQQQQPQQFPRRNDDFPRKDDFPQRGKDDFPRRNDDFNRGGKDDFSRGKESDRSRDSRPDNKARDRSRDRSRERDNKKTSKYSSSSSSTAKKRSLSPAHSTNSSVRSVPAAALPDKRRYESANLPKSTLIRSKYSANALRDKIGFSTHIPSDLKELNLAPELEFDFFNFPKDVAYEVKKEPATTASGKERTTSTSSATGSAAPGSDAPEAVAEIKHKFSVKVLLLSVPTMAEIYKQVVGGSEFDQSSSIRTTPFLKVFNVLANRNSSNGLSLIGGKWCPVKDGCDGTEPNLVKTAVRIVKENLGIDLKNCQKWQVVSTFVYNIDTNSTLEEPIYEITKVFIPDIWSCKAELLSNNKALAKVREEEVVVEDDKKSTASEGKDDKEEADKDGKEEKEEEAVEEKAEGEEESQDKDEKAEEEEKMEGEPEAEEKAEEKAENKDDDKKDDKGIPGLDDEQEEEEAIDHTAELEELQSLRETINDLRVVDLKGALQKFGICSGKSAKKSDLIKQLQDAIDEKEKVLSQEPETKEPEAADETWSKIKDEEETIRVDNVKADKEPEEEKKNDKEDESKEKAEKEKEKEINGDEDVEMKDEEKKDEKKPPEEGSKKRKVSGNDGDIPKKIAKIPRIDRNSIVLRGKDLSFIPLATLNAPKRGDQFELIVVSHVLRDALTLHFARYLFSALISKTNMAMKVSQGEKSTPAKVPVNYVHLAFCFFDRSASGSMHWDDLQCLFDQAGIYVSKKYANHLTQVYGDRIDYRNFVEPEALWKGKEAFPTLGGGGEDAGSGSQANSGAQYNVEQLIEHFETYQKYKVQAEEQSESSKNKIATLEKTIEDLLNKNKKLEKTVEKQSNDLSDVKKDKDSYRSKYDALKKAVAALSDL